MRRSIARSVCLAAAFALSACARHGSQPIVSLPPTQNTAQYTAIGASDAIGIGASVPCGAVTPTDPSCPGGTGYVPKIAALLANTETSVTLTDLGISGAVIGPDIKNLSNLYGKTPGDLCTKRTGIDVISADFLTNELPHLPAQNLYVTIFAGPNEVVALANALGCGAGGTTIASAQAFIAAQAAAFAHDYATLIADVQTINPNTRIVVANMPNLAGIPGGLTQSTLAREALQALSVAFDAAINGLAAQNIPVADLLCNAQSYTATNYSADGFHPNDAGYAGMASLMEPLLLNPTTTQLSTSCSQAALLSASQRPLNGFTIRNLNALNSPS